MSAMWIAIAIAGFLPIVGIFVMILLDDPAVVAFALVVCGGIWLACYALSQLQGAA